MTNASLIKLSTVNNALWDVDDNKLSHVDPNVVTDILSKMEDKFPGLTITRGKEHDFLGMHIRYTEDKKVALNLNHHILEAIEMFGEDLGSEVATLAGNWLFKTNDNARKLGKKKAETFHSVT